MPVEWIHIIYILIILVLTCTMLYVIFQIVAAVKQKKRIEAKRASAIKQAPELIFPEYVRDNGEDRHAQSQPDQDGVRTETFLEDALSDEERTVVLRLSEEEEKKLRRIVFSQIDGKPTDRIDLLINAKSLIGRSKDCDICIEDSSISRRHAWLLYENEKFFIEDCGSRNGTFVDGGRLLRGEKKEVKEGSIVQVGESKFQIKGITGNA